MSIESVHRFRSLIVKLALLLLCSTLAACTDERSDDEFSIVLRLSHVFAPKEELAIAIESVAQSIYSKTGGAVEILTYPQGQIASYKDGVEMAVRGAYFISVEYTQLVDGPMVQGWVAELEQQGIKILSLKYIFGFRNLITDREIRTPDDLAGIKLRTPGSKLFIETINAMGATATPLPWGETFSAIQQGVIDGLEGSDFTNIDTKVYETGKKNVALTNHFLGAAGVYISTDVWNKIPARYQQIIEQEFTGEAERMIARLNSKHADVVRELEAQGVVFNEVDRQAFEEATSGVFESMPGVDMAMYEQIQQALAKIRDAQTEEASHE